MKTTMSRLFGPARRRFTRELVREAAPSEAPEPPMPQPPPPELPPVDWPGYRSPWPSYMLEGREDRQALIDNAMNRWWFHTIDLGDGVVTPGLSHARVRHIQQAFLDTDFAGKKVLDIGCYDGGWSFAAEQRGAAEVYATDLVSQRPPLNQKIPNFELASRILNSRVKYFPDLSVYDVHTLGVFDFDVIIYMGVFYHIKDPVLALARLRQVAKPGAVILCEGEVVNADQSYAEFYYSTEYANDPSNWWIPSISCARDWLECNFFSVDREYRDYDGVEEYWRLHNNRGRCIFKATALPIRPRSFTEDRRNTFGRYGFLEV